MEPTPMTIAKIAEAAGVSVPTVSKVLNGRTDVAPATRARVEALIDKHQYRRRRSAGTPASAGGMRTIDLVFHELESPWAVEIIRGVERVARAERLAVVLAECGGERTPRQEWLDGVLSRKPDGVVMVFADLDPSQRRQLEARNIPSVIVDPSGEPTIDVPAVGSANWNGGLAATRHLLDLGHRRIGVIAGPDRVWCSRARIDGYRSAIEDAGIRFDPAILRQGDFHVESGYEQGLELLSLPERPTAVFAGSDLQALGLYRAANELGLRIPEDLGLAAFDDLPPAALLQPSLSSIRLDGHELGAAAGRAVAEHLRTRRPSVQGMATTWVPRESTAR